MYRIMFRRCFTLTRKEAEDIPRYQESSRWGILGARICTGSSVHHDARAGGVLAL